MSKDKPDAWMPLYIGDWESGTRQLDCEQDGAYGRLIRHYWKNGPPPDDDIVLARIVGMALPRWRKVRPVLVGFFIVKDGRWFQKRVEAELVRWALKREKAIEKAKAAAEKRWAKDASSNARSNATSTPQALLEQCPSASPTVERASKKALSHSGAEESAGRADGPPPLRLIVGRTDEERERAAWLDAQARAEVALSLCGNPDRSSEIAEFLDVCRERLGLPAEEEAA